MKTISRIFCTIILSALFVGVTNAQETSDARQLKEQFEELKSSSNSVQSSSGREYKVVNLQNLDALWNDVQNLLAASKEELIAYENKVDALNQEVAKLSEQVEEQRAIIHQSDHAASHINVLGIDIQKGKFEATFWIIIGILLVLLAGAIYQYKRSRDVTRRTQLNFMELQEEMEELRKTSLEKERRLRRELQTERNMIEELGRNPGYKR